MDKTFKLIAIGIFGVLGLLFFALTYFSVEQYERAVVTKFGEVVKIAEPGLHFRMPFVQSVHRYRTDIQNITTKPKEPANTYTIDNQEVDVVFNLFYRIEPAKVAFVYQNVQDYRERLFNMAIDRLKSEMGKINVQHVAEQRGALRDKITEVLAKDSQELGLLVVDFQLTNIEYTKSFRTAVEGAAAAKATVETREQERVQAIKIAERAKIDAEGKANAVREEAKGQADAVLVVAQAEAKAIQLKGEATAKAMFAQADALARNPVLVEMKKAERWNGQLPQQLLSNIVPLMEFTAPVKRKAE